MDSKRYNKGKTLHDTCRDVLSFQSSSQTAAYYDDWASSYEETMSSEQYIAPQVAAEEAGLLVPEDERPLCRVLDVAAGTGWVGRELSKIGFRNLDAVEPSEGMLKKLIDTGLYNNKYKELIGVTITDSKIPEGVYDLVVVAGGMNYNHIEVPSVDHFIRLAKPGGLLVIVTIYDNVEFRTRLEAHMTQLKERGFVKKVHTYTLMRLKMHDIAEGRLHLVAAIKIGDGAAVFYKRPATAFLSPEKRMISERVFPNYYTGYRGVVYSLRVI